jgi:hypothetical protein
MKDENTKRVGSDFIISFFLRTLKSTLPIERRFRELRTSILWFRNGPGHFCATNKNVKKMSSA